MFDGLTEDDVRRVVFVEVKTGSARLTKRECLARDAIEAGNVEYLLLRLPREGTALDDEARAEGVRRYTVGATKLRETH